MAPKQREVGRHFEKVQTSIDGIAANYSRDSGRYSRDTAAIPDVQQFLRRPILPSWSAISATNFAQP